MATQEKMLEELKKIREALEAKPPPPKKGLWNEFMDFMSKYKVLGLAVAFILGLYLGALVQALVTDLIMPLIGIPLSGLGDFASLKTTFMNQDFLVGHFIGAVITFIIVAFVIFVLVKITKRFGIE
jgi:large conductance mechanosensitive channel